MAKIKCKECGEIFNANLEDCPNCGCPSSESILVDDTPNVSSTENNEDDSIPKESPKVFNTTTEMNHSVEGMLVECHVCGKEISVDAKRCPHCGAKGKFAPMDFGDAIYDCFCRKYIDFSGRSRRSEVFPFLILVGMMCGTFIYFKADNNPMESSPKPELIPFLITLLPTLGAIVRRLHDIGRSGWWVLMPILPEIFIFRDSDKEENEYGKSPKYQPECFLDKLPDYGTTIGSIIIIIFVLLLLIFVGQLSNY